MRAIRVGRGSGTTPPTSCARAGDVLKWVGEGTLRLRLDRTLPLADAASAHRALEARETSGKIVLTVDA